MSDFFGGHKIHLFTFALAIGLLGIGCHSSALSGWSPETTTSCDSPADSFNSATQLKCRFLSISEQDGFPRHLTSEEADALVVQIQRAAHVRKALRENDSDAYREELRVEMAKLDKLSFELTGLGWQALISLSEPP